MTLNVLNSYMQPYKYLFIMLKKEVAIDKYFIQTNITITTITGNRILITFI